MHVDIFTPKNEQFFQMESTNICFYLHVTCTCLIKLRANLVHVIKKVQCSQIRKLIRKLSVTFKYIHCMIKAQAQDDIVLKICTLDVLLHFRHVRAAAVARLGRGGVGVVSVEVRRTGARLEASHV